MAITLSSIKITTASVNTSVSANFAGPVDFSSAVISGESDKWQIVSADSNLSVNRNYFANTTGTGDATGIAMTLTLPASANVGDTITVIDQTANAQSNNVVIARNGNPIDGANRNVILNVQRGGVRLVYTGTGWTTKKIERETRFSGAQGESFGYASGGATPPRVNTVDKFPFAIGFGSSTDVGDLSVSRSALGGQSSKENGYATGGSAPAESPQFRIEIDKFPFSTDTNATDIGDLTQERSGCAGQSSDVSGYASGGFAPGQSNVIDKFPFSTDTNASDVGDLTQGRNDGAGQSSEVNGYVAGGAIVPGRVDTIDKFPFATDTNATDVGNLTEINKRFTGQSSKVSGYTSGGDVPGGPTNRIEKFPFATDTNATDVADLTVIKVETIGQSSITDGYASGGTDTPPRVALIDRFPFASDANSTNIGDLTQARNAGAGHQA